MTVRRADRSPCSAVGEPEGRNEVTAGAPVGQALELIGLHDNDNTLSFDLVRHGTLHRGDIHAGRADGQLSSCRCSPRRRPDGFVSGTITVTDPDLLAALRSDPSAFYADVHTNQFPSGALRAQLHLLNHAVSTSGVAALQESVVRGSQIYACTQQSDGSFAFTQHDVEARLGGGIHHSFVQPDAGPPQWQAPDGSAVTGTVAARNTHGDGNIAELNLDATQIENPLTAGERRGGAAPQPSAASPPAGTCDRQATPDCQRPLSGRLRIHQRPTTSTSTQTTWRRLMKGPLPTVARSLTRRD
jgi:hypothetical protein